MRIRTSLLAVSTLALTPLIASAQDGQIVGSITPYGRALIHAAVLDDDARLENAASWVGLDVEGQQGDGPRIYGKLEWGVNLVQGARLAIGTESGGDFGSVATSGDDPFGLRFGYVGVDFGSAGRVIVGKQPSAHYDIAGMTTDRWNVFGGQGSSAYPAGTDGGSGTGRINQALAYRNDIADVVSVAAVTKLGPASTFVDVVGVSAVVSIFEGLRVGAAYTREDLEGFQGLTDVDDAAQYVAAGGTFDTDALQLGAVFSWQNSGDVARTPIGPDIAFDGVGFEVYGRYDLGRFAPIAGIVFYDPDTSNAAINDDFGTRYLILGGEYSLAPQAYLYAEARLDDSENAFGASESSALAIGFRYGFSRTVGHSVY